MRFSNLSQWFAENLFNIKSNANELAVSGHWISETRNAQ
jgi:hypothetical protein